MLFFYDSTSIIFASTPLITAPQGVIQENNLGVGRGKSSKPNPSEVS